MNFKQGLRKKDDDRDENEDEKSVYTLTILEVVCVLGGLREDAKILEAEETSKNEKPKMSRKSRRSLRGESSRKQQKSYLLKSMVVKTLYR